MKNETIQKVSQVQMQQWSSQMIGGFWYDRSGIDGHMGMPDL